MVRRFLFCAALIASCIGAGAQTVEPMVPSVAPQTIKNVSGVRKAAPAKVASLEDTGIWGYYTGDYDNLPNFLGFGEAITYDVAYYVPATGVLEGASINGVNIPFLTTNNMSNISAWISTNLTDRVATKNMFLSDVRSYSYCPLAFDEPYAIPAGGCYVGVSFTINSIVESGDKFPVGNDPTVKGSNLLWMNADGTGWADYGSNYGAFAMQLFVSNLNLPQAALTPVSLSTVSVLAGSKSTFSLPVQNNASSSVKSIDYTLLIGEQVLPGHVDLATPIRGGYKQDGTVDIEYTAPQAAGSYALSVTIDKVNGVENTATTKTKTSTMKVVKTVAKRRTVVEEFTGTGCPNCPRGWLGMETMKELRDKFIGIAFHKYNANDPMYVANYYSTSALGISGAPACSIDRKSGSIDPFYGSSLTEVGILDDFDYYNSILPVVDVHATGVYNEDRSAVNVTCAVDYLMNNPGNYTAAYVLTADELSGTTESWRQTNNLYSSTQTGSSKLDIFRSGGKYGSSYVYLTFSDVMIASSYTSAGVNQASPLVNDGNSGTGSYRVAMPTKATLLNAIDYDKVYAVVLITNNSTREIENAVRVKVLTPEEYAGIAGVTGNDSEAREVARFNAAGQLITAPQKGLNIVKYSDGRTVKVVVK